MNTGRLNTRALSAQEATVLPPGGDHYRAYVGPPADYDVMGATQFHLACSAGLRESHSLLDFGCGSLRAGRLFITYLLPGKYYGLEPNTWLIDEAIDREIGRDAIAIKRPTFRHDDDFDIGHFNSQFDFIVAQSVFSHAGRGLVEKALLSFQKFLKLDGVALVTFIHPEQLPPTEEPAEMSWVYPGCVAYEPNDILAMIEKIGLKGRCLKWHHPRQKWYALAHDAGRIPLI
jgi:SAM-dependent methyltransferase